MIVFVVGTALIPISILITNKIKVPNKGNLNTTL
jgi:hypothetical protein